MSARVTVLMTFTAIDAQAKFTPGCFLPGFYFIYISLWDTEHVVPEVFGLLVYL